MYATLKFIVLMFSLLLLVKKGEFKCYVTLKQIYSPLFVI